MRLSLAAALVLIVAVLALAACGGDADGRPQLTVSAATSLKTAFERYGRDFGSANVRYSFAGSDELAAQIRQGVRPDVYAAANLDLPSALNHERLVERPVTFARNRLVIATPAGSSKVRTLEQVAKPGVKVVIGSPSVPVGKYTRTVLGRLPQVEARGILANVRSSEPDVAGVVGKLAQGAADAGFVYVTDVRAAGGRLRAVELPAQLQPSVAYGVAVVNGTRHRAAARAFVAGLLRGDGRAELQRAGFELP